MENKKVCSECGADFGLNEHQMSTGELVLLCGSCAGDEDDEDA